MEIQPARGIQRQGREKMDATGNNNIGQGFQKHWQGTTSFPANIGSSPARPSAPSSSVQLAPRRTGEALRRSSAPTPDRTLARPSPEATSPDALTVDAPCRPRVPASFRSRSTSWRLPMYDEMAVSRSATSAPPATRVFVIPPTAAGKVISPARYCSTYRSHDPENTTNPELPSLLPSDIGEFAR